MRIRVGIVGISGFGGGEAMRLVASHPSFELIYAAGEGSAGSRLVDRFPGVPAKLAGLVIEKWDPATLPKLDVLFASLPTGASAEALARVARDVHGVLADYYAGETFVPVRPLADRKWLERDRFLRADRLIDTNSMELAVYGNEAEEQILAVASLDNLGKGASGAAVQTINLKTGVDEATGLTVAP